MATRKNAKKRSEEAKYQRQLRAQQKRTARLEKKRQPQQPKES